jgi:hypothetical protein
VLVLLSDTVGERDLEREPVKEREALRRRLLLLALLLALSTRVGSSSRGPAASGVPEGVLLALGLPLAGRGAAKPLSSTPELQSSSFRALHRERSREGPRPQLLLPLLLPLLPLLLLSCSLLLLRSL